MMTETTTEALKTDPVSLYMPWFMAFWAVWGIASWLWIRSRPSTAEKKLWHKRVSILSGVIFGGVMSFFFISAGHWPALFIIVPAFTGMIFLGLRFSFYCDSCGKFSQSQQWFSSTYHCPHCGHKLK